MSASVGMPVLRGELFELGDCTLWASGALLRATGLRGDDRGVFLAADLVSAKQEAVDVGPGAAVIGSRFGALVAIHVGPGPVFALMLPDEAPTYLASGGALGIEKMRRVDLERWNAGYLARQVQA